MLAFMSFPYNQPPFSTSTDSEMFTGPSDDSGFPQWETLEQPEQQQQQQQQQQDMHSPLETTPTPSSFHSVHLELDDPPHIVPSHVSPVDDTPITLHHPHALHQPHQHQQQQHQQHHQQQQQRHASVDSYGHISRPGSVSHLPLSPLDELLFRPQSTAPPTPNPAAGPSKSTGAIRSASRSERAQLHAPYYRPSVTNTATSYMGLEVPGPSSAAPLTRQQPPKKPAVRFAGKPTTRATSKPAMPSPAIPSPASRFPTFGGTGTGLPGTSGFSNLNSPFKTSPQQAPPPPQTYTYDNPQAHTEPAESSSQAPKREARIPRRPLPILSDMHYSEDSHTLFASLELPGVKKHNVHVKLATCYFNHIKFVSVEAENAPVFEPPVVMYPARAGGVGGDQSSTASRIVNPVLRERHFGMMRRVIQVPSHTKIEDVDASMEDGVLSLRIYCGKPFNMDDEQVVPVRG